MEKKEDKNYYKSLEMIYEAKKKSRQSLYISWAALVISIGHAVIRILAVL